MWLHWKSRKYKPNGYVYVVKPCIADAIAYPIKYNFVWRDRESGAKIEIIGDSENIFGQCLMVQSSKINILKRQLQSFWNHLIQYDSLISNQTAPPCVDSDLPSLTKPNFS